MNFLELAQRLRRKCRISGVGPTGLTSQTEEYNRVLDWTNEAYVFILNAHPDWQFMRATATCPTVQGTYLYDPVTNFGLTDFGNWALDYANGDTFRNFVTASGYGSEVFMETWDYDWWRDAYLYGALRATYTRPLGVALAPNDQIACGPMPAAGYTLVGDYYKVPADFTLSTQEPAFPEQFHMAIVYKAMTYYGVSEAAPEIYDEGEAGFNTMIRQMERRFLPRPQMGGALA